MLYTRCFHIEAEFPSGVPNKGLIGLTVFVFIFRLHCSTTYVDTAYCYRPSSVVCKV